MQSSRAMPEVPLLSMRVLIVEDDGDLRVILKLILEHRFGFKVIEAQSAELGIELAQRERPDLILMDLMLPEMGGIEAISILRVTVETKDIPIIVISDCAWQSNVKEQAKTKGAYACIDKATLLERLPEILAALIATAIISSPN
jgi:CheY-like chemotaxis protein